MSDQLNGIECVVFDFGEVLIELDYPRIIEGFSKVASLNKKEIDELVVNAPLMQQLETSQITPKEFRKGVNELLGMSLNDEDFDEIWNSMLKNLPKWRMDMLWNIRAKYRTFVLSNSNIIHEIYFNRMIKEVTGKSSLHDFVEKCYFSHDIKLRKPYKEAYEYIIQDIGMEPSKMVFLDDRLDNCEAARASGINAIQITDAETQLRSIFNYG